MNEEVKARKSKKVKGFKANGNERVGHRLILFVLCLAWSIHYILHDANKIVTVFFVPDSKNRIVENVVFDAL